MKKWTKLLVISVAAQCLLADSLHAVLDARPEQSRESLKQLLQLQDTNKAVRKRLFARIMRMSPDQQDEAIELIRQRGGKIRRRHGRTDGPVVKISFSGPKITSEDLFVLVAFPQLRILDLSNAPITDDALEYLEPLPQLRSVILSDKITDAGLVHLKRLRHLRKLWLSHTHLRHLNLGELFGGWKREIAEITSFPGQAKKREKKPAKPAITDAGLEHLEGLTALEELYLWNRPLNGSGLAHLKRLSKLRFLYLDSSQLADAAMSHLAQFPSLERLTLPGTNITDAGLTHLYKLKRLQYVCLDKTKVTDKGIVELRKALPMLDVLR